MNISLDTIIDFGLYQGYTCQNIIELGAFGYLEWLEKATDHTLDTDVKDYIYNWVNMPFTHVNKEFYEDQWLKQ